MRATTEMRERARLHPCQPCSQRAGRLESHMTRMRENARVTTHRPATVDAHLAEGSNLVSVINTQMSSQVAPGTAVSGSFYIKNDAQTIVPGAEPDWCVAQNINNGYRLDWEAVSLTTGSQVGSGTVCVPQRNSKGPLTFQFNAPLNEGSHDIHIRVSGHNSGNLVAEETLSYLVDSSASGAPTCPDGFERDANGNCVPGDDGSNNDGSNNDGDTTPTEAGILGVLIENLDKVLVFMVFIMVLSVAQGATE